MRALNENIRISSIDRMFDPMDIGEIIEFSFLLSSSTRITSSSYVDILKEFLFY